MQSTAPRQVGFTRGYWGQARGKKRYAWESWTRLKNLLSQNADKVETVINKAGEFVDEQTQGNYSDAIHKLHDAASNVVGMSDQQS